MGLTLIFFTLISNKSFTDSKLPLHEKHSVDEQKCHVKADEDASEDINFLLEEPYSDENFGVLNEGLYLETDDFLNPIEEDLASFDMLHEYVADFNANDEIFFLPNNYSVAKETQLPQEPHTVQKVSEDHKMVTVTQQLANAHGHGSNEVSSTNRNLTKFGSGSSTPIVKHTNRMLESIPAPPAFAAEFPTKEVALHLASATESQNTVSSTSGMLHARKTGRARNGMSWSFD